jgi:polyisoprenoid-binding protein YceI
VAISSFRSARTIGVVLSLLAITRAAVAQRSVPDGVVSSGSLSFDAHANVGDFVGTTTTVSGQLTGGPDLTAVRGWVETPVRTLKTGNDHRDRDLNKSLASDRYPTLRFELTSIGPGTTARGDSIDATLHGSFSAHGMTRDVDVPVAIAFSSDSTVVRGQFPLDLKDFQIGGLGRFLGILKMNEHILVHVALVFRSNDATNANGASVKRDVGARGTSEVVQ